MKELGLLFSPIPEENEHKKCSSSCFRQLGFWRIVWMCAARNNLGVKSTFCFSTFRIIGLVVSQFFGVYEIVVQYEYRTIRLLFCNEQSTVHCTLTIGIQYLSEGTNITINRSVDTKSEIPFLFVNGSNVSGPSKGELRY